MSLVVPFDELFAEERGLTARHSSWTRVPLGEVSEVLNGFPFKSTLFTKEKGQPVIRIRDLDRGFTETRFDGEIPEGYTVQNRDLLIGMDGIFRCVEWVGGHAGLNQRVCKITPDERYLEKGFLKLALNGYLKKIEDATSSVTVGHLSSRDILRIPFPLPPLAEQRRIVAKVEELLGKVSACRQRLAKIPTLLKRFRQSVLAAACSGRLTADWRNENRPASRETERCMVSDKLDLVGWQTCQLGSMLSFLTSGSRGWAQYYANAGSLFVRAQNINTDRLILDDIAFVNVPDSSERARTKIRRNDLLITITGANVAKSAVVDVELPDAYVSQHVALARLTDPRSASYLLLCLTSPAHGRKQLLEVAYGQGKPGLNLDNIRAVEIDIPPFDEQQEIIRRAQRLLAVADQLEARYRTADTHVEKLTQAILAKAFRGELVPTEHELAAREGRDYESAEQLLARVRQTGSPTAPAKRKPKEKAAEPPASPSPRPPRASAAPPAMVSDAGFAPHRKPGRPRKSS